MLKFTSTADLLRLQNNDPAYPVISLMIDNLFTDTFNADPDVIALMEPGDVDHPLTDLSTADDISLEGIVQQQGMYLVVLKGDVAILF